MDYASAIQRVYDHLEHDKVESAVMLCLRIARVAGDHISAAHFTRELNPEGKDVARVLHDDMAHLKPEARKFVFDVSLERWMETHHFDFLYEEDEDEDEGDRKTLLQIAVGDIAPEIARCEGQIADLALPTGMSPYDTAAFTDRHLRQKRDIRWRLKAVQTIQTRLKARCMNYAIQLEKQLKGQERSQLFLETVQTYVNNYFKERSVEVYDKLMKASQLVSSLDKEDASLLLTEVRRASKAVADLWFPPLAGKVLCADGKERLMGEDQYLNRLQQFVSTHLQKSTSREVLQSELDLLASFIRRLNDMASKGVHAAVTLVEAKQGLLGLYLFLFNVCQQLEEIATEAG